MKISLALLLLCLAPPGEIVEDFEGASAGRAGITEGWERVRSDAHPPYNAIELVRDSNAARSGTQFVRLRSQGGSTSLRRTDDHPWPVEAGRPYRFTAWARLSGTRRNTASVALTWLRADGTPIGIVRTPRLSQTGSWTELMLEIPAPPSGAAAVSARLDFEGPDVRGECDFDRLVLAPVARIDARPAGRFRPLFEPGERPRFDVALGGFDAGIQSATLSLRGPDGREVRRSVRIRTPEEASASVDFPPIAAGAHELTARVDGTDAVRRAAVLVPNPWISDPDSAPPVEAVVEGATEELVAWAGLRPVSAPDREPIRGSIAEILRRLIRSPRGPIALDGTFVDPQGDPLPSMLALRAANDVLSGAVPMADPELLPRPARAAAFRKGESVALAIWCEEGERDVTLTLNEGAKLYPPLGAVRPLRPGEPIRVGPLPVFVVQVDGVLLEMAAQLRLAGPPLPLQRGASARTLRLHNPSRTQELRDLRIRVEGAPADWRVSPREIEAARLAPGSDRAEDLWFTIPANETERTVDLRFELRFTRAGRDYVLPVSRPVRLASPIGIEATATDGPRGNSRIVTIRATNRSDRPMSLVLRSRLPNLPEQIELAREIAPGASTPSFQYLVKDAHLIDPSRLEAEVVAQEAGGDGAWSRATIRVK